MESDLLNTTLPRDDRLSRFTYSQYHMGMDLRMIVYATDRVHAENACTAAFSRVSELDWTMSDYRQGSELMKLCRLASTVPTKVSSDLLKVLMHARELSARTSGAYDVTTGPVVKIWRAARNTAKLPGESELATAMLSVGWDAIAINPEESTVSLKKPNMQLDLGGIGKGFALDEAQAELKRNGIHKALLEMGGDIVVSEAPPMKRGWTIRIPNAGNGTEGVDFQLSHCAVSTSGDTEQFTILDGVRYSHVVDPRTGWALSNRVQTTVIADSGVIADPLSTALTVLSSKERDELLAQSAEIKAYVRTFDSPELGDD